MGPEDQDIRVVVGPAAGQSALHRAALLGAARAHPGEVVSLLGPDGVELARAVAGDEAALAEAPVWRLAPRATDRRRVALLDRDGTIIEDRHYLSDPGGVTLLPGALHGLRMLTAQGILAVILTNQSGVARGRITPAQLEAVHERLRSLVAADGVQLGGIFSCPHGPDTACSCRKPAEGLAHQAACALGFALTESVVVGDKASDLELGHRLGVPAILVRTGEGEATLQSARAVADYLVENLAGVAGLLTHPAGLPVPVRVQTG